MYITKFGKNSLINKALLKYGYSKFKVEILEYCDRSDLIKREQYYIDLLKPEYNILQKAGSSLGYKHTKESLAKISRTSAGRTLNEETRAKMSAALKGEQNPMFGKKGEMHPRFSKKHSDKTLAEMSNSKTGEKNPMFGKKHSEETRVKMSSSQAGEKSSRFGKPRPEGAGRLSQKIEVIDIKNNIQTKYDSISDAALTLNIAKSTISKYLARNDQKFYKRHIPFDGSFGI